MRSFQTETAETAALTNYESRRNAHDTFSGCCVNGLTQASAFSPAIRTWGCLLDLDARTWINEIMDGRTKNDFF